jgi:hypothetical protein
LQNKFYTKGLKAAIKNNVGWLSKWCSKKEELNKTS